MPPPPPKTVEGFTDKKNQRCFNLIILLNNTHLDITTMAEEAITSRVPVHLPTYKLGDEGKPNHLNESTSREAAAVEAKSLTVGDAAFIKRSDLKWTYAVVTEKSEGDSVVLRFEVDKDRNCKSFPEAQWGKYIRIIQVEESELASLQAEADKIAKEEATHKKLELAPSSAASVEEVSIKTGKSGFFSNLTFKAPKKESKKESKKEAKKEVETEPKPAEEAKTNESNTATVDVKVDVKVDKKNAQDEVSLEESTVEGLETQARENISSPEATAPKVLVDEPDDTKENPELVVEAPQDTLSPLRNPLKLRPVFSLKRTDSNASTKSNGSMLSKLGLKKDKKSPASPTDKKPPASPTQKVSFESVMSSDNNSSSANLKSPTKADDITKKEWFDTEACEVDYDKNPTDLFQALESREFAYAESMYNQACPMFTKECKTWVVARKENQDQLRFRALPLHASLVFGAPSELVKKILHSYPLAARGRDVKGRLPIHLAMEHNASEEVVGLIIEAFPKGMFAVDKKNMAPLDYINGNMERVHMKKYLPLIIAAKVDEERAKWEVALAGALEEQKVSFKSDTDFMKPIVESVTEDVESIYAGKLSLVEANYQKEIELMKKKNDSETQALLDGFEVKLNFERKLRNMKINSQ